MKKSECQFNGTNLNIFKMAGFSKSEGNLSKFNANENRSGKLNTVLWTLRRE